MRRTSGPSPCTLIRDAPGGTTSSPGAWILVTESPMCREKAGDSSVTTTTSSLPSVPLSRSSPTRASVCASTTFWARTIAVRASGVAASGEARRWRSKYWAAAMSRPASCRVGVAVASADRGSSSAYKVVSLRSAVEAEQVGGVVAGHAAQVLFGQAEIEQCCGDPQPGVHRLRVRGLTEVGGEDRVLGTERFDPGHQVLRVPFLVALGVVHADLVLDVGAEVDEFAAQVRLRADDEVGVADDHPRDAAFLGGDEQRVDVLGVHVTAVDDGLLLL